MHMKRLFVFSLAVLLLVGCLGSQKEGSESWKTYDVNSFSISYPSDWQAKATPQGVMFVSPNQGANLQAGSYPVSDTDIRTLDEYIFENKKELTVEFINQLSTPENQIDNVEILSESVKTINGQPARQLEIKVTPKTGSVIRQEQIYFFKGQTGHILTATATEAGYNAEKDRFTRAFESFVIK